jgi:hypothetical protein
MYRNHGEILGGTFYAEEIQKVVKQDDAYKIQSVLKKLFHIASGTPLFG